MRLFAAAHVSLIVVRCAGRFFQKGDVMAFGMIHKRARGVGVISYVGGFAVGVLLLLHCVSVEELRSPLGKVCYIAGIANVAFAMPCAC